MVIWFSFSFQVKSQRSGQSALPQCRDFPTLPFLGHGPASPTQLASAFASLSLSRCTLQAYRLFKSQFKRLLLCEAFSKSSRDLRVLLLCSYGTLYLPAICPRTQSSDHFSLPTPSSRLSHKLPFTFLLNLYLLPWLLWVPGLYIKYLPLDV